MCVTTPNLTRQRPYSRALREIGIAVTPVVKQNGGVSVPDSVEFLRQNGLDKLVDGYAVCVFPSGDQNRSVSQRVDS